MTSKNAVKMGRRYLNKEENKVEKEKKEIWRPKRRKKGTMLDAWCQNIHKPISRWILPADTRGIYRQRAKCLPPPVFITIISTMQLVIFIYYAFWKPLETMEIGIWDSPFIYRPDKRQEAWRFLSYMMVHAGVQHISGNVLMQLILGLPLETVHKGRRVGLVYLSGVIAGSLGSSVWDPFQALVGASGGVYALTGGYFMNVLVNFKNMVPLFGLFRLVLILFIVVFDMGFALYRKFISPESGPPISIVAHVAGGVAGMTVGFSVFSCFQKELLKDSTFRLASTIYFVYVLSAVCFNIFLSPVN
ncbi:rhomboid-related protein 2 [Monodelphis domestica]|uniref:Rhomboid-related protein 2 n=1 Tax=Monodelphis domestica TaxID=13616 RepID=A0A5F8GK43_MONDO|nr:rhomboid-related protein 2 [Monodelphis domestica]